MSPEEVAAFQAGFRAAWAAMTETMEKVAEQCYQAGREQGRREA